MIPMKVIKLNKIDSTQDYLKKILESQPSEQDYLVIAQEQTGGIGRHGNNWEHIPNSIAISFTLDPNPTLTLSSIEIGVLVAQYFHQNHQLDLELKWPNDLFYKDKKCGGILIHIHKDRLIVGLGINAHSEKMNESEWRGGLNLKVDDALNLHRYILESRITDDDLMKSEWLKRCMHLNQMVQIGDKKGKFTNLGPIGEAVISNDNSEELVISGSLRRLLL